MKSSRFYFRTTLLFLSLAGFGLAQSDRGTIHAQFTSEKGETLPGVSVTLTGPGFSQTLTTNDKGTVHFADLVPGIYTLNGETIGFEPAFRPWIHIDAGSQLQISYRMEIPQSDCTMKSYSDLFPSDHGHANTTVIDANERRYLPLSRDPQAVLETIPGIQTDTVHVGDFATDQRGAFASMGDDGRNTVWAIDGIDISDPAMRGQLSAFLDFGMFEQMAVITGGSDMSIGSSGAVVNLVTKRGTNEHSGNLRLLFSNDDLQSTDKLTFTGKREETLERGIDFGGPIIKDRLWYWGAFQQTTLETSLGQSNSPSNLENLSFKIHGALAARTRFSTFYTKSDFELAAFDSSRRSPESTQVQRQSVPLFKIEIEQGLGQHTDLRLIYGRVDGGFDISPRVSPNEAQPVFSESNGRWENSYRDLSFDRQSRQYELRGTTYLDKNGGKHEFQYGFQYKEAWTIERETWGSEGSNLWVDDYSGLGSISYFRAHRDVHFGAELESTSLWLQDDWTLGRLALTLGVRYNQSDTQNLAIDIDPNPLFPEAVPGLFSVKDKNPVEFQTFAYQFGASYSLGAKDQFLVQGSYRKYFDPVTFDSALISNRNGRAWITGFAQDYNGDGQYDASELGFALDQNGNVIPYQGNENSQNPYFFRPVGLNPNGPHVVVPFNRADPDLEPPKVDEFSLSGSWNPAPGTQLKAVLTHRRRSDTLWERTSLGQDRFLNRDDYQLASTLIGTHPETGRDWMVDYYVLTPEAFNLTRRSNTFQVLTNRPDYREEFTILELQAVQRLRSRWLFRAHFTLQDWTKKVGPGAIVDPTPDPTLSNVDGSDVMIASTGSTTKNDIFPGTARWTAHIGGLYKFPGAFTLGGTIIARDGFQNPSFVNARGFAIGNLIAPNKDFSIEDGTPFRHQDLFLTHLKLSKSFQWGPTNFDLAVECFNVFNEDTVLQTNRNYGLHFNTGEDIQTFDPSSNAFVRSTYGRIDERVDPRTFRLSLTVQF